MGRFVQNQPEEDKKTENNKLINIHIGVFFDGTSNNKFNINEYRHPKEDRSWIRRRQDDFKWYVGMSYKSDFSNVAKLSDFYNQKKRENEYYASIYIEGIATAPRKQNFEPGGFDSYAAAATGMGEYGINGKVERACIKVVEKVQEIVNNSGNKKVIGVGILSLDVFGFSRGAAAARRFVSCVEKASGDVTRVRNRRSVISVYHVSLRQMILEKKLRVDKIKPCFMGLFDTVSSYGLNFQDDVEELTLGVSKPEMVVQLVAADEYRENFALTRIKTANGKSRELILPGEHCDIGGSHKNGTVEKTVLQRERFVHDYHHGEVYTLPPVYNGYKTLEQLLEEGWIRSKDEKERTVNNKYSIIPLLLMYRFISKNIDHKILKQNKVLPFLTNIKNRIDHIEDHPLYKFSPTTPERIKPLFQKGDADCTLLKSIRHGYLHLSAQGGLVNSPAPNNIRLIIDDSK